MEYGKIIAITGLPGLYEMVSSKSDGAIVRSLDDQATKFVSGRVHNFTHLESIEVYTERENVNLVEVLTAMQNSGEKLPDEKDNKALQAYFQKVFPTLDFDRVYSSDMKKMVKWFDVLKRNNVEIKLTEQEPEEELVEVGEEEESRPSKAAAQKEKKTKATKEEEKPSAKKEEPKKTKAAKEKEEPKKPAKKAAAKKEEPKKKAAKKK